MIQAIFNFNNRIENLLINHIIVIAVFFTIYFCHYKYDKQKHFIVTNNETTLDNWVDILYFTTTTHTTVGFGDIIPKSKQMKLFVILHHIIIVLLVVQLFYYFHLVKN